MYGDKRRELGNKAKWSLQEKGSRHVYLPRIPTHLLSLLFMGCGVEWLLPLISFVLFFCVSVKFSKEKADSFSVRPARVRITVSIPSGTATVKHTITG